MQENIINPEGVEDEILPEEEETLVDPS